MAVVIKMSGAGYQTDRHGPVSTARRLGRLSQTARLRYGFRTVDTWNMTAAKFRDFLPGRCRCHFHQVNFFFFIAFGSTETCTRHSAFSLKKKNAAILCHINLYLEKKTFRLGH